MGLVVRESFYNILSALFAIGIGALNTVVFFPLVVGVQSYGILMILLAQSNILQPIFSFGLQNAVIKFFSAAPSREEQDKLLLFSLIFPLLIIVPSAFLFFGHYTAITDYLSSKNEGLADFIYLIFVIAVSTAYFEIFFSWARVQKKTVVGNFMKEVYQRVLISGLLLGYFLEWYSFTGFIHALIVGYYIRLAIMVGYSLWLYRPKIYFSLPSNHSSLLLYMLLIFLSAFGASVIIDIDASMLGKLVEEKYVAYYKVGVFIAALIDAPLRALQQIISPLVAEAINNNHSHKLKDLLRKSSVNLLLVSGLFFVLINANIDDFYGFIYLLNGKEGFSLAIPVVLYFSMTKLFTAATGCVNNIITNSKYYYVVPFFSMGSAVAVVVLNLQLIEELGFVGAAVSTFLVITLFNLLKVLFVWYRFRILPFNKEVLYLFGVILLSYGAFSFLHFPFPILVNLVLKCLLIGVSYLGMCYVLGLSLQVNAFIDQGIKKLRSFIG